jgi:hypothetical protein
MRGRELVQELRRRELPQGGWSFGDSRQPSVEATTLAILASAAEFAVTDAVFEPRNPFEPVTKRRPKTGIAVAAGLAVVVTMVFLYFSLR